MRPLSIYIALLVAVAASAEIIDVTPRTIRYSDWKELTATVPCEACTLKGNLRVINLPKADSTAQALRGLKRVEGDIFVKNNRFLRTLEGLSDLEAVEVLYIESNPQLYTLKGLETLHEFYGVDVGGPNPRQGNASLTDVSALAGAIHRTIYPSSMKDVNEITFQSNPSIPDTAFILPPSWGYTPIVIPDSLQRAFTR